MLKVRTLFLSDIHLGYPLCQAESLLRFLDTIEFDQLYLIGDIIDIWHLEWNNKHLYNPSHLEVLKTIIDYSKNAPTFFLYGNHDSQLVDPKYKMFFGLQGMSFSDSRTYETLQGQRFLVSHGDKHDLVNYGRSHMLTKELGDLVNGSILGFDHLQLAVRKGLGLKHWSLTNFLADKIRERKLSKQNLTFRQYYEQAVSQEAGDLDFDGAICGHIHLPTDKDFDGVRYLNDGDWVTSCTALVETYDGKLQLLKYKPR